MTNLKGSEKQIAWAEQIIADAYKALDNNDKQIENLTSKGLSLKSAWGRDGLSKEATTELRKMLDNNFATVTDAAMIINIRGRITKNALIGLGRQYMVQIGQIETVIG